MAEVDQLGANKSYAFDETWTRIGPLPRGRYVLWSLTVDALISPQGGEDIATEMTADESTATAYSATAGAADSFVVGNVDHWPVAVDGYFAIRKSSAGSGSVSLRARRAGASLP